ncbi:MAG TPA: amylo-alpha-1,6-glucosidase [Thermomicrobiales bacterium]|nr:amylo-alpha-1,6-glucosidase [Thermomicrobiales bacterium]
MTSILDRPLVSFGRAICGDVPSGLRREWLVTNGLGGYASGTLAGPATRRYHGLLVAALTPPVGRTVLVGGLTDWATYDGQRWPLAAHEYADGTLDPHGYRHLQAFALEGSLPVWTFALADALLERRVWMAHGANTTYVRYTLTRASAPLTLEITPLVTYRDFHTLTSGQGWQPATEPRERGVTVRAFDGARPLHLLASAGAFAPGGGWWWNFHYREETARGLDDRADLFAPGTFSVTLQPGETYTLVLTAEDEASLDGAAALAVARERQRDLLHTAGAEDAPPAIQQLVLAADQFIVARGAGAAGKTVIAGYHWFNDWGRDTMIALPGLTLATNRAADAADILRTFARYVSDGLLPNNFPDSSGAIPGYNTADATLWYFVAIHVYHAATGDDALVAELLPTLRAIADRHLAGTRYGIGVDPADGLLRAGEPGVQLTWMDAKVGDWVVTPRIGKPVEINALWYNTLRILAAFLAEQNGQAAAGYTAHADRARNSFRARFIRPDGQGLFDVVDGPAGDDASVRPNQIFAAALPFPLLDGADASAVVAVTGRALLTTYGLRSLAPTDPAYRGDYGGDQRRRDGAYHQGPVWPWLLGAYADAYARAHNDPAAVLALVQPFEEQLRDAGLGSLSEILEGDPPHQPRGAIAQAWSVAEVLRVWRRLTAQRRREA